MMPEERFGHIAGLLPAYINGALDRSTAERVRQHLLRCAPCRGELAAWEAIGDATRALAFRTPTPSDGVLDRVWAEIDQTEAAPRREVTSRPPPEPLRLAVRREEQPSTTRRYERITTMIRIGSRRISRPIWGAVAAAAVAGALILTPVGSYAQDFITIFQPKQIAAVPVTSAELDSLPDLADYGTVSQPAHQKPQHVANAAAASAASGMTVLVPGSLPSGIPTSVTYEVMPGQSGSFTFSAAKAQAAAAAKGKRLPPMPANVDGSSIQITTGPAVAAVYANPQTDQALKNAQQKEDPQAAAAQLGPMLIVGQTTAPVVKSTGVSAAELENYLLEQPGISPDLANAIRAIGDPSSTLLIPIPVSKASSHQVQVQGVTGLAVADSTGLGGGIVWQKNGVVYGVAGTLTESQLIAVANSLHLDRGLELNRGRDAFRAKGGGRRRGCDPGHRDS